MAESPTSMRQFGRGTVSLPAVDVYYIDTPSWSFVETAIQPRDAGRIESLESRLSRIEETLEALEAHVAETPTVYNAQVFDLGVREYRLRFPLLVTIESYPDEVVARLPQFDLYASAQSDALAVQKLMAELVSTYVRLEELGSDELGPLALQWLSSMRAMVECNGA